jgi:hypothetical protein
VIAETPEGHRPPVHSRVFHGVRQPVCIVLVARGATPAEGQARVRARRLPEGPRADTFAALTALGLEDMCWDEVGGTGGDSFLPWAARRAACRSTRSTAGMTWT